MRGDEVCEAPGRDCRSLCIELLADPADDAVDLACEPVHEPGLEPAHGRLPDHGRRRGVVDLDEARRARDEALRGKQLRRFHLGTNYRNSAEIFDFAAQVVRRAVPDADLPNAVRRTGGRPEHLVRLTWYVLDKQEYLGALKEVGAAYRELMGRHFPAMAVVQVSGLVEDQARLEIEATAVITPDPMRPEAAI